MTFFARKHAEQILAADDTDHLPVSHHGHALDPMGSKQTRDLAGIGVLADGETGRDMMSLATRSG